MNACIEILNRWGENFLSFAWPMLWQSSLLVVVVFVFDILLAKNIRASVRYALWMVVLVKLLLPPPLALPTGATWWLWRPTPVVETPIVKNYTVTYDDTAPLENFVPQTVPIQLPPPKLNGSAWTMIAFAATGTGLLLLLAFRWTRVARKVRRATASDAFTEILEETRQLAGLRRPIRLKLINDTLSPAVYGLFRPVILLPLALMEKLSTQQLRAVLLHEAIHLRRGDVWVNCAQTLLQIAYWWHPLLWLANVRIRRLREEAVDDAVMAALRDGADAYAPTLLEVAKFAFRRPLASLGLIGIMESRSALRQRIERLVDFHPPRKAGITFLSLCGIFIFSAVALPMGQGPVPVSDSFSVSTSSDEKTLTMNVNPEIFIRNLKAKATWMIDPYTNDFGQLRKTKWEINSDTNEILLNILQVEGVDCAPPHNIVFDTKTGKISAQNTPDQLEIVRRVIDQLNRADGKSWFPLQPESFHRKGVLIKAEFFWMTPDDLKNVTAAATYHRKSNGSIASWTADAAQFNQIEQRIKDIGLESFSRPGFSTSHGMAAETFVGTSTNWIKLNCEPYVYDKGITLAFKAENASISTQNARAITNRYEIAGKETVDDDGGIVVSTANPNNPQTNLVIVLNVKNDTEEVPVARKREPWPDPNFAGYRMVNLCAQFLILDESQLRAVAPRLAENLEPTLLPADKSEELMAHLKQAGARCFCKGWEGGILQPPLSGGYQYYRIGSSTDGTSATTALTTNWGGGGSISNILYGYDIRTPATEPDWTPMNLTLHALKQDGSTLCQMDLSFPNTGRPKRHSDMLLPNGDSLVWTGYSPNAPGKCQVIILSPFSSKQKIHDLVKDGKMLYEMGKLREAKSKLNNALALDPGNEDARYYLKLIQEAVHVLNQAPPQKSVSARTTSSTQCEMRTFKVGVRAFLANLQKSTGSQTPVSASHVVPSLLQLFSKVGVDLFPPKKLFYNDGLGVLFVYATHHDLDVIERIVVKLNYVPPMVHIKARFIEVPSWPASFANTGPVGGSGILAASTMKALLHQLESQKDVEELSEPEATLTSGRQVHMRATTMTSVVTGYTFNENSMGSAIATNEPIEKFPGASTIIPKTEQIEMGPVLEAVPTILGDNYTIKLQTVASLTNFLGYANTRKLSPHYATNSIGQKIKLPIALPVFQKREATSHAVLYDGQTLVLFLPQAETVFPADDEKSRERVTELVQKAKKKSGNKTLVAFVTVTVIDAAGNRIHSDEEMHILENTNYIDTVPISANVP